MGRTANQDKILKQERLAGKRAAKIAQAYLLQQLKQKLHIRNQGGDEGPLLEVTKVKAKIGKYRLLGLNLTSSKVGFVLNYGFVGVREATGVYLNAPRYNIGKTQRERHQVNLPERNILEEIYFNSGAADYLLDQLRNTRTEAIKFQVEGLVLQFNALRNA